MVSGIASGGRSRAGRHSAGDTHPRAGSEQGSHGKGAEISALAHTTTATGSAKGATISAAASGGRSHAGEHGQGASGHHGGGPAGHGHGHGAGRPS
jgi:hypothetical protein